MDTKVWTARCCYNSYVGCSLAYVRRSANQVADCLAKAFVSGTDLGEWRDLPPPFLVHVLELDLQ